MDALRAMNMLSLLSQLSSPKDFKVKVIFMQYSVMSLNVYLSPSTIQV